MPLSKLFVITIVIDYLYTSTNTSVNTTTCYGLRSTFATHTSTRCTGRATR